MASFGGLGDSVLAPEAVEDLDGEPVGARDFVLTALSPGEQDYQIGVLEFDQFGGSSCSLVCIAVLDNKLLVAVPQEVWSRTVSQRLLNPKGLTKPFLCSVAAKPVGAEEGSEALNCKAWVGFLQGELENQISFPEFPEVTFGFGPSDGPPLLPVKGALLEVSNDHFVFQTGESATGAAEGEEEKVHGRLKVLEDSLLEIQRSLSVLTSQPSVGGVPTARPGGIPGGPVGISCETDLQSEAPETCRKVWTRSRSSYWIGSCRGGCRFVSRGARKAPGRNGPGVETTTQSNGRCPPDKEQGSLDAYGGVRRGGRTRSHWWRDRRVRTRVQRGESCSEQANPDLFDIGGTEAEERRPGTSFRRIWIGKQFREQLSSFSKTKRCGIASPTKSSTRESSFHIPVSGGQPVERFPFSSDVSRRTAGDCQRKGMADVKESDSEFHRSCTVELAGSWNLGCVDSGSFRRSSSSLLRPSGGGRPVSNRRRIVGSRQCCSTGGATSLPGLCNTQCTIASRASTFHPVGSKMDRSFPGTRQGAGQLYGVQEETLKRWRKRRRSERRRPRRCWRPKPQEGCESKESSQRGGGSSLRDVSNGQCSNGAKAGAPFDGVNYDSQLNSATGRNVKLKIPGASARTYSGKGVLVSMLRFMMKSRCRLGGFARSFVSLHFAGTHGAETAPTRAVFPVGLPFPEVCRRSYECCSEEAAQKRGLNAVVIVMNYLHFNRPRSATGLLQHRKLNARQWEAIRCLKLKLEAWILVSPTGPEEMGRSAGKFESIEETLMNLERKACALAELGQGYVRFEEEVMKSGAVSTDSGVVVGHCPTTEMSTFKPVDPERISFVGQPKFRAEEYLDPKGREVFLDPLKCRDDPDSFQGTIPRVRVHCSLSQKVRLFELLDASQRLHLWLRHEVDLRYGAGMFCVVKSLQKDRLILDSRPGNLLEKPLTRWIKSLASGDALLRLVLEQDECVLASGNDVRDFYHLFSVSTARSKRNCLVGTLDSRRLGHLSCIKPHQRCAGKLVGSLATLAMGDSQAVELAQTCHLSMALSHGVCLSEELITLSRPLPRTSTLVGVLIDDFVSLSRVRADYELGKNGSAGAVRAEQMQEVYRHTGLIPHEEKAFRDQENASFWGIDLEGRRGLIRGSIRRAVPLAHILLQLAEMGVATVDLLQTLAGALISLMLYRRRMLCLLDALFESYRGRGPREIVRLSGKCRSELLACAILLPLAASNLKAQVLNAVVATDASNWGQAGVRAKVPEKVARELYRHCLRKSVWTKLLGPHAEWLRRHDLLAPEDELPGGDKFDMHPLWAVCAQCLDYELMFAKQDTSARHINVSELRGFLRAEAQLGRAHPGHRLLFGLDSQVCLGAISKGRSSSKSLNKELSQALAGVLFFDVYSEAMYFDTKKNRADAPTRGRSIPKPDLPLPVWWNSLAAGKYEEFDKWMKQHGLDGDSVGGLPDFHELLKDVSGPVFERQEDRRAQAPSSPTPLNAKLESERLEACKDSLDSAPSVRAALSARQRRERLDQAARSTTNAKARDDGKPKKPETIGPRRGKLSAEVREKLMKIPKNQFVMEPGEVWPPQHPGHLDLFSGERGVARNSKKLHTGWTLCYDLEHSPLEDLRDGDIRELLCWLLENGAFVSVGGGPVCSSFSTAITPPIRSREEPYGISSLAGEMLRKVLEGNEMSIWFFAFLDRALGRGITAWIENPAGSWMFKLPEWGALCSKYPTFGPWLVDYCRFGTAWRKRTKIFSTTELAFQKTLCKCPKDRKHLLLRGRSRVDRKNWTRVAQAYPNALSKILATAIGRSSERLDASGKFEVGECAKCGKGRIGEAANPGPRGRRGPRDGVLSEFALVEPKTELLQTKVWNDFVEWLCSVLSKKAAHSVLRHPLLSVRFLQEYGDELYSKGGSLFVYRHLVVFAQKHLLLAKPYMSAVWDQISRWELQEPTVHRTPLPAVIFRAMVAVSLSWGWVQFSAVMGLSFFGISRPGEVIREVRKNLILPSDLLEDDKAICYLRLIDPKSRRRGKGRLQHLSLTDRTFIHLLEKHYKNQPEESQIYAGSAGAFRRRWDKVLDALLIPSSSGSHLTPGSLRGGGAVWAWRNGMDLPQLMFKMRLKQQITLESYLQEVSADLVLPSLPEGTRSRISAAASLYDTLVAMHSGTRFA